MQAETIHIEHGYTPSRPTNLKNLGEVLMNLGDHDAAFEHLSTSKQISNQLGMSINEAYAEIGLCRLSLYKKKTGEAEEHLRNAHSLLDDSGDQVDDRLISMMTLEAQILAAYGDIENALTLCSQAVDKAEEAGFPSEKLEAQRVYGSLCTQAGDYTFAEELLLDCIKMGIEQNNPYREAGAHHELGCLYATQMKLAGDAGEIEIRNKFSEKALRELNLAIEQFQSLGAQFDLNLVKNAIAILSAG
jgi:tetratricopeptide (TPR) repeat protein